MNLTTQRRWNSTFWIKVKANSLSRHHGIAAKRGLGPGKKTKANRASNARLKKKFEALEITRCELNYDGCTGDDFLSWAHGRKRRKLQGDELDTLVILSCTNCHTRIERMAPEGMLAIVQSVIAERGI